MCRPAPSGLQSGAELSLHWPSADHRCCKKRSRKGNKRRSDLQRDVDIASIVQGFDVQCSWFWHVMNTRENMEVLQCGRKVQIAKIGLESTSEMVYGTPMAHPWHTHGTPMAHPWHTHGTSWCTPPFPTESLHHFLFAPPLGTPGLPRQGYKGVRCRGCHNSGSVSHQPSASAVSSQQSVIQSRYSCSDSSSSTRS